MFTYSFKMFKFLRQMLDSRSDFKKDFAASLKLFLGFVFSGSFLIQMCLELF